MKTDAKITVKEIRAALACDVATGKMTQEVADRVTHLLGLDWKEKQHNDRKDMDCFLEDLHELFEAYDAGFFFSGTYSGEIWIDNAKLRFVFGSVCEFDKDFIALLPKVWKRSRMVSALHFPKAATIDEIRPILDAVRQVDRKAWNYVTDKKFSEMIKPYKKQL